ncbi:electron transport complex subunit RsxB [Entomomonas asaccharolytica]|uniref:Electron transport complex subunit RsxB n=2 Tax=Entomomonas asaccharolytica TaxID=2785331 RepID=A0A974RY62_9GAMM|nr:electron transport complex subunit RsxB [Entomomonas asaccharolytica]
MQLINLIDALLPQTQCTKCGYQGCKPYAEAIANGDAINKCPPGGEETINALAALLDKPVIALAEERSPAQLAYIREAECIGCTKCIQACPVDAIVGAAKLMHTVIETECTGCELCVAPCPVDCIDIIPLPKQLVALTGDSALTEEQRVTKQLRRDHARNRFEFHKARLEREEQHRQQERQARLQKTADTPIVQAINPKQSIIEKVKSQQATANTLTAEQKKLKIEAAMIQVALNKAEKQLKQYNTPELQQQVDTLKAKLVEAQQLFNHSLVN